MPEAQGEQGRGGFKGRRDVCSSGASHIVSNVLHQKKTNTPPHTPSQVEASQLSGLTLRISLSARDGTPVQVTYIYGSSPRGRRALIGARSQYPVGSVVYVTGKVKRSLLSAFSFLNPKCDKEPPPELTPNYRKAKGLKHGRLTSAISGALSTLTGPARQVLSTAHASPPGAVHVNAVALTVSALSVLLRASSSSPRSTCRPLFEPRPPVTLTESQVEAVEAVSESGRDCLLLGDVGSGKTLVMLYSLLSACASSSSSSNNNVGVYIAPTNLLAEQTHRTFSSIIRGLAILLPNSSSSSRTLPSYPPGSLIVSTPGVLKHLSALKPVLTCVDEEQRYGRDFKARVEAAGGKVLYATATPIPRSSLLGGAEYEEVFLVPRPGVREVETTVERDADVVEAEIVEGLRRGKIRGKILWVCPRVGEGEVTGVVARFNSIMGRLGPRVGMIHGRQKREEQVRSGEERRHCAPPPLQLASPARANSFAHDL